MSAPTRPRSRTSAKQDSTASDYTMPRPRRRKDGTIGYQVRFRITENGRRVQTSRSFDDSRKAWKWAQLLDEVGPEQAVKILAHQLETEATQTITIGDWLRRYADSLTGNEEATIRRYHRYIVNDVDAFMGYLPIEMYTPELDASWVSYLEHEVCNKPGRPPGNSPKTVRNKHGFVSEAMSAAARHRPTPLVPGNPCADTRLPTVYGVEKDYFNSTEYELFDALLAERWRPMFEFMVMSAARPGEVFALTVGDIDPETGAVRITKAYKYDDGKRKLGKPKSTRGVRTAYVPLETIARLDLDRPRDAHLFVTENGSPLTVVHIYKHMWMPALRRLDALAERRFEAFNGRTHWTGASPEALLAAYGAVVEGLRAKRITPYTCRHTGISWRLQDGVPIWVVSRDAGHESVTTTDKQYGHIDSHASMQAAQTVAGRLPDLRRNVVSLELARRRRLARAGQLGELCEVPGGYEAVWMDADGTVQSAVFGDYDAAVEHIALHEAYEAAEDLAAAA